MSLAAGARGLLLALLLIAAPAFAAPKFPPLTGRVVDNAQMLSPANEQALTADLAALEAQTGHQVVVATVPDLQGYEIEEFGYQLGRFWQLGRKGEDDGAILLVAPAERKVRIEVGYGLEPVLTDALSSVILQTAVLPLFREGRMEEGVVAGAQNVIQQLALPEDEARAKVAEAAKIKAQDAEDETVGLGIVITFMVVLWLLGAIMRGGRRGRRGDALWLLPLLLSGGGGRGGGWGGGGFSGGGGSFGGGGSSGSW
jgi:uncharacterized protein